MKSIVTANASEGIVTINGQAMEGQVWETGCQTCGTLLVYHEKYDALFCPDCNQWIDACCRDHTCRYCGNRPKTPLEHTA